MNVPARLDVMLDEVGVGAMLKHLVTDRRALVVDVCPGGGDVSLIVAMICDEWVEREDGESAHKPEHYKVLALREMKSWLVLHAGHDRLLDHEEDP